MKKKSFVLLLSIISFLCLIPQIANAVNLNDGSQYTLRYDKNGNLINNYNQTPYYIKFNPDYKNNPHYKAYKNKKLYGEYYRGEFFWYTIVPKNPDNRTATNMHMYYMRENRQKKYGSSGWKLVNSDYSWNLKKGRVKPNTQHKGGYKGDNSGTTYITAGKYEGKHYEWRYLGYSIDGTPVNNPFFPADYPSTSPQNWAKKNYLSYPWKKGYISNTSFDKKDVKDSKYLSKYSSKYTVKEKALAEYFIPKFPEFKLKGKSNIESAKHWAKYFSMQTDPRVSSAIITGFHKVTKTTKVNGKKVTTSHVYYITFTLDSASKNNLRIISFKVIDPDTNKVMATLTRDDDDNKKIDEKTKYYSEKLDKGKEYIVEAVVKNMKDTNLKGKDTKTKPLRLDYYYLTDERNYKYNAFDELFKKKAKPTNGETTIKYGKTVTFRWTQTVPTSTKKIVSFGARIPYIFYKNGENYMYPDDDEAKLTFGVTKDDIGLVNSIKLVNKNGKSVKKPEPYETYRLKFTVEKYFGSKAVGDPKNLKKTHIHRLTSKQLRLLQPRKLQKTNYYLNKLPKPCWLGTHSFF